MLTPELGLRIVQQPYVTARDRGGAVARGDQEIHLQRTLETPHEIAQKDEAPLEQPQHDQLAVGIGRRDLAAQLPHAPRDRLLVEDDAGELTPARLPGARCPGKHAPAPPGSRAGGGGRRPGRFRDPKEWFRRGRRRDSSPAGCAARAPPSATAAPADAP